MSARYTIKKWAVSFRAYLNFQLRPDKKKPLNTRSSSFFHLRVKKNSCHKPTHLQRKKSLNVYVYTGRDDRVRIKIFPFHVRMNILAIFQQRMRTEKIAKCLCGVYCKILMFLWELGLCCRREATPTGNSDRRVFLGKNCQMSVRYTSKWAVL